MKLIALACLLEAALWPQGKSDWVWQDAGGKLRGAYGDVKDAAKKTADALAGKK